ncbi:hypothetical protein NLJ89_g2377 [Agrocybe chaxingu]|uniref:3-beta hydroxysteroid dehydrogenase/isomerase domain-containing protein n=1 Tax=Agrocybe chaxingu TaxID=84603 RepID=A0A9W8MYR1_9AGAR|nr:hypothetical protein NLJ89_g2377 [Agrocybe chaxingu]
MSKGNVLVTGVTGFIATQVALTFLDEGYSVRGSVRSADKGAEWIALFPQHKAKFEYVVVADMTLAGAFNDAVKGVDYIAHVASPAFWGQGDNEKDILLPAINGTKNLVEATKIEPKIKRVVFTSSLAAVINPALPADTLHTPDEWNPMTYEEAKNQTTPMFVYRASKALAEKTFWEYIEKEKPTWAGSVIAPWYVKQFFVGALDMDLPMDSGCFGPPLQKITSLAGLNVSVKYLWNMADGTFKNGVPAIGFPVCSDVRDVALAHVRAVERDAAKNQRYLVIANHYNPDMAVEVIGRAHPELKDNRLPPVDPVKIKQLIPFNVDTSKTQKDLGIVYTPFEKTIVDTVDYLLEVEKQLAK